MKELIYMQQIETIKNESLENFKKILPLTLNRSAKARAAVIAFRKSYDFENTFPTNAEILAYFGAMAEAKFGPWRYREKLCWINPQSLIEQFIKVDHSEHVAMFFKDFAWSLCDIYGYGYNAAKILNEYFPDKVKRKHSNRIYRRYLLDMGVINERKPYSEKKLKEYFAKQQIRRDEFISRLAPFNITATGIEGIDVKKIYEAVISGEVRKLQKMIFPLLAQTIILKQEGESGKQEEKLSMPKAALLFDIISILSPESQLFDRKQFEVKFNTGKAGTYDGKYNRYQRAKLRTIMYGL